MSSPSTPLSISTSTIRPDSTPRPFRPFSPSPPRDNIHTASRPASLFLGTAVPASPSLTDAQSFNILGLPPTPEQSRTLGYFGMPREMPEEMFTYGDREIRNRKTSRVGQPGEVDRTTATAELAVTRDSLSMVRSMSSLSTTSSASPPLGSASILSTLADAEVPSIPFPKGRISGRSSGYSTPPARSPEGLSRNPQSASSIRTALSDVSSITGSKSMPRLHQPTVVRSTSGKGVSFLPPPGRASATSSLGRTRTSRTSAAARFSLPATEAEEKVRDRKYHSLSGGESRPRSISYLSDLGPPVHFPKSPTVPKSASQAGDREAERMLKSKKIEVKGGPTLRQQESVLPYGMDVAMKPEIKSRNVLSEKKKDLARDRPIDQLFPRSSSSQAVSQEDITRDNPSDAEEPSTDPFSKEDEGRWEGETLSRMTSGKQPGASRSPSSRLTDYLASDASSYTGGRGVSEDDQYLEGADGADENGEKEDESKNVTEPSTPIDQIDQAASTQVTVPQEQEDESYASDPCKVAKENSLATSQQSVEDLDPSQFIVESSVESSVERPGKHFSQGCVESSSGTSETLRLESHSSIASSSRGDNESNTVDVPSSRNDQSPEIFDISPVQAVTAGHSRSVSDDFTLHEVTDDEAPGLALQMFAQSDVYIPPYKVRHPAKRTFSASPSSPPIEDQKFAITLLAGVSRQSRTDPLSLTIPHVELYLAWNEPRSWLWLPARKYIPAIDLRMVRTGQEVVLRESAGARHEVVEMRHGLVRGVVRGVVGRLPVVWRLANWV